MATSTPLFFKTSLEIRDKIYQLLLVSGTVSISYTSEFKGTPEIIPSPLPAKSAAILRVCRQIQYEAESTLYKSNQFIFRHNVIDDLPLFLTSISDHAYYHIKKLTIHLPDAIEASSQYLLLLLGCRGLKELNLEVNQKKMLKFHRKLFKGLRLSVFNINPQPIDRISTELLETVLGHEPLTGKLLKLRSESRDEIITRTGTQWYLKRRE